MKFVLQISGPSCSGKSTVEAALGERFPGTYLVSYDKLKWQLFGYHRDKDRETVKDLLFGFYEVVCARGLNVFTDTYLRDEAEYRRYRATAEAHGYRFVSVRLTAPEDVLLERFRERVAKATAAGSKTISVTDEATYRKNLSMPAYLPPDAMTFDTSAVPVETIAQRILTLL